MFYFDLVDLDEGILSDCLLCFQAMLGTQERVQQTVPGFRFNLGFSGKYFHHGTFEENLGDDMLLGRRID